ncbi:MAG: hypothetical protein AAGD25_30615 [Cyanobacteria bacterium P01_F01_bin.150]
MNTPTPEAIRGMTPLPQVCTYRQLLKSLTQGQFPSAEEWNTSELLMGTWGQQLQTTGLEQDTLAHYPNNLDMLKLSIDIFVKL